MRTIVHLSDLHFGRVDHALLQPLQKLVTRLAPDVLVVSGDLTQRARVAEFTAARAFLDTLPGPQIIVPGNHDIPLYNVARRFFAPLQRYQRHMTLDLAPEYVDDEIAVLGINSARSLTFKHGRISHEQIGNISRRMHALPPELLRIVVSHHPFDLPDGHHERHLINRAPLAMAEFAQAGVDLLLAGHLHASHAGHSGERYQISGYAALVVQAGTATSTRGRGEANAFNVIEVEPGRVQVQHYNWQPALADFVAVSCDRFERRGAIWALTAQG